MNEIKPKDAVFESRAGLRLFYFLKMQLLNLKIAFYRVLGLQFRSEAIIITTMQTGEILFRYSS